MKPKVLLLVVLLCGMFVFSACGSEKADAVAEREMNEDLSTNESDNKSSVEDDVNLSEKYKDVLNCLENGDYDGAIALINAMKPQPDTETISITLDNWSEYFSIEDEYIYTYDANGAIDETSLCKVLKIKPEYEDKQISLTGTIGYEYTSVWHTVTDINKEDGSFIMEITDDHPNSFPYEETSKTENLTYPMYISVSPAEAKRGDHTMSGGFIQIKNADDWEKQWVLHPEEVSIVRIEGELVLQNK